MRKPRNRALGWVIGIHVAAISLTILVPAVRKRINPRKKEIITYVTLADHSAPAPAEIQPVEVKAPPEPAPPEPAPVPEPKPMPKPKPKPVPKPKPKPKWKPAKVIPQNPQRKRNTKKPAPTRPVRKQLSAQDIRNALGSPGVGTPSEFAAYYDLLFTRFHSVWQVPIGTAYGVSAKASITVGIDGTVSNRRLTQPSGNAAFDQSVRSALNTINRLPKPPANLPSRTITIEFVPQ